MADKERTQSEKLKWELATALKEEILEKLQPYKLYRSGNNRKFFYLQKNRENDPYLNVLNTGKVYDPDFAYKLGKLVMEQLEIKSIALFTGCWGMTDNPVGAVRESNKKELKKYFDTIADRLCDVVRNTLAIAYTEVAVKIDLIHKSEKDDEWDK